jgi:serine/threonine protein kinase
MAVKILENVADNIEEIEEEYLVLRDLSMHPNIPAFYGLFLRPGQTQEEDQLWFVMEVSLSLYGFDISIAIICIFLCNVPGNSVLQLAQFSRSGWY